MTNQPYISLTTEVQQLVTAEQAWHYHIVPKQFTDSEVIFYAAPSEVDADKQDELEMLFGRNVVLEASASETIQRTLGKYYRRTANSSRTVEVHTEQTEDFLDNLITEAQKLGSSDIHIEIYDDRARVRMRMDGLLVERYQLNKDDYPSMVNKIKIKANLDIAEKRLPQDGRIHFKQQTTEVDIRVSVLPTLHGEKVVMRLLSNDATNIDIERLGFSKNDLHTYLEGVRQPNGIVLISGPTGSGKTTTLYATLKILNEEKRNIVTVEDPIEYTLEGINQVQLRENIGLTFSSALRSFLRQDPDIIMLGEIRDAETAQMAIRAALTGHLVLSTIHTNSAWGTISRLIDMGVQPFLLASTINTSVAQRLLRLLCPDCKTTQPLDKSTLPSSFAPPSEVKQEAIGVGCESCYYTGYRGRTAIYEVISVDNELGEKIKTNDMQVTESLHQRNIKPLSQQAWELFAAGKTALEEVYPLLLNS